MLWSLSGLFLTGMTAGALGALLGLGGGIFLVPALTLLFGLSIRGTVGTSLVGVIATSAVMGILFVLAVFSRPLTHFTRHDARPEALGQK